MLGKIVGTGIGLALGAGAGYGIYEIAVGIHNACYEANQPAAAPLPSNGTTDQMMSVTRQNIADIEKVAAKCDAQHPVAAAVGNVDHYVTMGGLALVGGILGWIISGKL